MSLLEKYWTQIVYYCAALVIFVIVFVFFFRNKKPKKSTVAASTEFNMRKECDQLIATQQQYLKNLAKN